MKQYTVVISHDQASMSVILAIHVDEVKVGTQLNGGYKSMTTTLGLSAGDARMFLSAVLGKHVKVYSPDGITVIFEGRISSIERKQYGLDIQASGYYEDAAHLIDGRFYAPTGDPPVVTLSEVIKGAAELIDTWKDVGLLGSANYNLITIDSETLLAIPLDYTELKIQEVVEKCLSYGYSEGSPEPAFLTIYNDGIVRLFNASSIYTNYVDQQNKLFILRWQNISGNMSERLELTGVYNKVYAIYANEGDGPSWTDPAFDYQSKKRYGLREGVVQNGGNPEGLEMGESLRDYALQNFRWPRISMSVTVKGDVELVTGATVPLYNIRAGDVVMFGDDFYSIFHGIDSFAGRRAIGLVVGTTFDSKNNTIGLTLGSPDKAFDIIMSRLNLSGGLK